MASSPTCAPRPTRCPRSRPWASPRHNGKFPPATRMLGDWKIYKAEELVPPAEYIQMKRKK